MKLVEKCKKFITVCVLSVIFSIHVDLMVCFVMMISLCITRYNHVLYNINKYVFLLFVLISVLSFVYQKICGEYEYFMLVKSLCCRDKVLILQNVRKSRDLGKCPKKIFKEEMQKILEDADDDTIFYCVTQSYIVSEIRENTQVLFKKKAYRRKINDLKKQLRNNACKEKLERDCEKCSTYKNKNKKTQFYAIAFRKKNTNHQ